MTENEGIAGIANGAINALKGSPTLLVLVLLNIFMLFGVGYVARSQVDERRELVKLLADCGKEAKP